MRLKRLAAIVSFRFTSPAGSTVLTDPWRNDATGLYPKWLLSDFPAIQVDIVLSTHAHFDHDAVERPKGLMVLERLVRQFKFGDVGITGLADIVVGGGNMALNCGEIMLAGKIETNGDGGAYRRPRIANLKPQRRYRA